MKGAITVLAATSLTEAFKELGAAFSRANPQASVTFSFDASSTLASQILQGASADLFAAADTTTMDRITSASQATGAPVVFATNRLSIIVAPGNPLGIRSLADLTRADLKVVVCDPAVPCGKYAQQSLDKAGVAITPASREQNVKGVVTKVTAGEADAGIVYSTDVKAVGGKAAGVEIASDVNVVARYPIAPLTSSKQADVDAAFLAFVISPAGQAILATFGFGPP